MKTKVLILLTILLCCGYAFAQNDTVRSFWKSDYRNGVSIGYSYKNTAPSAISLNYRHKWYGVGVEFSCAGNYYGSVTPSHTTNISLGWDGTKIPDAEMHYRYDHNIENHYTEGHVLLNPQIHSKYISVGIGMGISIGKSYYTNAIESGEIYHDMVYSGILGPYTVEDESRRNRSFEQTTDVQWQYLFHIKPNVSVHYPIKNWEVSVNVGYSIIPQKNKTENYALADCDGFSFGVGIGYMW